MRNYRRFIDTIKDKIESEKIPSPESRISELENSILNKLELDDIPEIDLSDYAKKIAIDEHKKKIDVALKSIKADLLKKLDKNKFSEVYGNIESELQSIRTTLNAKLDYDATREHEKKLEHKLSILKNYLLDEIKKNSGTVSTVIRRQESTKFNVNDILVFTDNPAYGNLEYDAPVTQNGNLMTFLEAA